MSANYCGESHTGMFAAGRASINVYAIKSTGEIEINKDIILKVLDILTDWLIKLEQSENVYRAVNHSIYIYWKDGEIIVEKN